MTDYTELKHIDLGEFVDWVWALKTERDQLRAEVAGLKTGYEAYELVNAELKAECARSTEREILQFAEIEALRKDAERYRWTCIEGNWVARFHGKWRAHIGEYGDKQPTDWYPSRGEAIDAAMGKGEQS